MTETRLDTEGHYTPGESGTRLRGTDEREGARAAGSRKQPTGPHYHKSGRYRHGANGDGKEPRSVPVLRLTYCFAALVDFSST
eukprot:scaffold30650_cov40-Attheya_sp.AAC.1